MSGKPPGFRVKPFEQYLRQLIETDGHDAIARVETFAEAGLTDKPCGLKVAMANGACIFVQFVRTSPPGGEPDHPDFHIPDNRL